FTWEAAEVVDRSWRTHRGHLSRRDIPVGGNTEHGPGSWNVLAELRPAVRPGVALDGVHRVPVTDENGGHPCHQVPLLSTRMCLLRRRLRVHMLHPPAQGP